MAVIRSAVIDAEAGECPGYFFKQIGRMIGGSAADPPSHIRVTLEFLRYAWTSHAAHRYREPVTGLLLNELIRDRTEDYKKILRTIAACVADVPALTAHLRTWLRGHFLDIAA
jgi:hypothetical protein